MDSDYDALRAVSRTTFAAFGTKGFNILEPGTPFEYNWHFDCIAEHLQAQFEGDSQVQHLIINEPPRCLKSVEVAQLYPAWVMGRTPSHQFIGSAYAHSLAERNVMKCRQLIQSDFYRDVFPGTKISDDMNKKDYFTTTMNGQYKGTGIGGTITGFGCSTLVIDDPLNPREAVSDQIRTTAINEIRSTLFSRYNKFSEGRLVMIMQRLHDADPTGDLLKDGGYYHLKLPAYATTRVVIDLRGRQWVMEPGDYLTPRLDAKALDKLKTDLGEYHFSGQYMQEPVPIGGGAFKPEWIGRYNAGGIKPKEMNIVILVDPSGGEDINKKKKKLSDWSAFMVVGLAPDGNYYLLDIIRDRLNPTDRVNTLFMLHRKWLGLSGKSPKVGYEKYGMMTDTHYIRDKMAQDAYNFSLVELGGAMSKEERIMRLVPDMQNGRWFFPQTLHYVDGEGRSFDLVHEIIHSEMPTFPRARFDDMLDALSRIYEPELFMVFPKPKMSMKELAFAPEPQDDGWESF